MPPQTSTIAAVCAFAIAALLGYAAHRASICNVKAVLEILGSRRAFMLASFAKAALWATAVYGTAILALPWMGAGFQTFEPAFLPACGGFVFGAGAAINGGCSVSTLQRLADGEIGMLMTLIGLGGGLFAWSAIDANLAIVRAVRVPLAWREPGVATVALVVSLWLAAALEVWRLWRSRARIGIRKLAASDAYRLSTSAMLIGIAGGLLNVLLGSWTYTYYLRSAIDAAQRDSMAPGPLLAGLLAAMLGGMVVSSIQRRSFRPGWGGMKGASKHLLGGLLMGVGAALIPGGNDSIVLTGIPTLSGVALATYLALLLGIASALLVQRAAGAALPLVVCAGDTCKPDSDRASARAR
ncbi:MAG TPA: YeeE/YedE thiosulfate transporter family protein [Burkholderiaceae bacterium]